MSKPFRLILRYSLPPDNHPENSISNLLKFVDESHIHEVMFKITAEEMSCGHTTIDEVKPWVAAILDAKRALKKKGVEVSLNPWTTTYHNDRGRILRPGQNFHLLVGETGTTNGITACPLDRTWQDYLCKYFSYLVGEIDPVAIWVEDDWRLHNHGPHMNFGGCFCRLHMERFGKMVGQRVARKQILNRIAKPGKPHPWRDKWIDLSRQSLLEPAQKLSRALRKANPKTRVGLMSSHPDVHSIEGRDWDELFDALRGSHKALSRPCMQPYNEEWPVTVPPVMTRHAVANLPGRVDIYPEMESSPRSGIFSKSRKFAIWQIYNSALFGAHGMTMNHFGMMGVNTYNDPGFGKSLGAHSKRFNALLSLGIKDSKARGVRVLFSPRIASHLQTKQGKTLLELKNASDIWGQTLYVLGIGHRYVKEIESDGGVYAVSDQTLRAFSDAEIKRLLSGRVLLDATSVETLLERGFGKWIGIEGLHWKTLSKTGYSFEQLEEYDIRDYGGAIPRMCAQRNSPVVAQFLPNRAVSVLSTIRKGDGSTLFPGSILYANVKGGRIFSTAYPFNGARQFFMAYFNRVRQKMVQDLLFEMSGPRTAMTTVSGHMLHLHAVDIPGGIICGVSNVSYDEARRFELSLPASHLRNRRLRILNENGTWKQESFPVKTKEKKSTIMCKKLLKPLDFLFLRID